MISERFSITLNAAAVKILYISFPKPASDAFANTKPCLQNCSAGRSRTLETPETNKQSHPNSLQQFFNKI